MAFDVPEVCATRPFQKTNHPNNRGFPREKHWVWDRLNPGTT
jgi:hypothetical protein